MDPAILGAHTWSLKELVEQFPPQWRHANKRAIAKVATPPSAKHDGRLAISRWRATGLPSSLKVPHVRRQAGHFRYQTPAVEDGSMHWHLNFADPHLFGYAEGELFAQDELQCTEHPALVSVGYALEKGVPGQPELQRIARDGRGATPVLLEQVPRRCAIDSSALYGDQFSIAREDEVLAHTQALNPPTMSHLIALAAIAPQQGHYTKAQITDLVRTAFAGFRAAVIRSGQRAVTLHTGHWGCGAFGGNKGLVGAIQILSAGAAGVDTVEFWFGSGPGDDSAIEHAFEVATRLDRCPTAEVIQRLAEAGYSWGHANENHVPFAPPERDV